VKSAVTTNLVFVILFLAAPSKSATVEDASIDRLLSKLSTAGKDRKPHVQQALQMSDPATKDPIVKQILQAETSANFPKL